MTIDLQHVVDNLGRRLDRSVAIDDHRVRLLAYNSHSGRVDALRLHALRTREAPQALVDDLHELGGYEAEDLLRQPVRPDIGLTIERIVMPIRLDGVLLGFLWLLASDGELSSDDADAVRDAAGRAAEVIQRDRHADDLRQSRTREILRDLLSEDELERERGAQTIVEDSHLVAAPVSTLVLKFPRRWARSHDRENRRAIAIALDRACATLPPRVALRGERGDHGVIVVANGGRSPEQSTEKIAGALQRYAYEAAGLSVDQCFVGIGNPRNSLELIHESYSEARRAAGVAEVVEVLGSIVRFSDIGVYGLLAELPHARLAQGIHPGLRKIHEYDAADPVLALTLEEYLRNAGDVKRTADRLHVHRASVYYRLKRIEEIGTVDLANGEDRLALDISLKITRLLNGRRRLGDSADPF